MSTLLRVSYDALPGQFMMVFGSVHSGAADQATPLGCCQYCGTAIQQEIDASMELSKERLKARRQTVPVQVMPKSIPITISGLQVSGAIVTLLAVSKAGRNAAAARRRLHCDQ